ncbi:MAG: 6-pyruvoyl-tetrahydropterin synthase-related protein [Caldilineaceae bacterium]
MTRIASLVTICLLAGTALFWGLTPWPATPDGWLHLQRVRALAEALQAGVLYPRWFPDFSFGYGYPVLNYYAPAFYYPLALLVVLGLDVTMAARITLSAVYAVSAVGMYALLRLWVRAVPALVGVVLFLVFPYRLFDLFVRGALPEFVAFFWLPLIAWLSILIVRPQREQTVNKGPIAAAALCWAGLILTHNLTAMMAAITAAVIVPVAAIFPFAPQPDSAYARRLLRWTWAALGPLLLGALVSAWYWVPAILEARSVGIGAGTETAGYARHFASLGDLFAWSPVFPYPPADAPTVPLPAWLLLIVALAALGLVWRKRAMPAGALACGLVSVLMAVWLTTASSAVIWRLLEPLLGKLQFPWRWQTIAGTGLAVLLAAGWQAVHRHAEDPKRSLVPIILGIAVGGYLVGYATLGLSTTPASGSAVDFTTAGMWAFDSQNGQVGASWTGEFLPNEVTEQRWAIGRAPSDGSSAAALPSVEMSALPQTVGYTSADYAATFTQRGSLIFHQFYFPAWRVLVDGLAAPARAVSPLGLLAVEVGAGTHTITLAWSATTAVWVGRVLTAVGWALVLWLLVLWWRTPSAPGMHRREFAPFAIGAWALAGVVLLVGASGVTAKAAAPVAVAADFGTVRLEAAAAEPARPGRAAQVNLYWSVQGPVEPLVAFVHVVDGTGAVVAQNDGPLGGDYTPVERWLPGMVMARMHNVPLPADLPPGRYALKAGVYRPGQADAPLVAEGTGEARVDIGTLEVQP